MSEKAWKSQIFSMLFHVLLCLIKKQRPSVKYFSGYALNNKGDNKTVLLEALYKQRMVAQWTRHAFIAMRI